MLVHEECFIFRLEEAVKVTVLEAWHWITSPLPGFRAFRTGLSRRFNDPIERICNVLPCASTWSLIISANDFNKSSAVSLVMLFCAASKATRSLCFTTGVFAAVV